MTTLSYCIFYSYTRLPWFAAMFYDFLFKINWVLNTWNLRGGADSTKGGSSSSASPPPFEFFLKIYFFNTHKRYCNQHAVFTMYILFSTITDKARLCAKEHKLKPIPRPGSKIPGSTTVHGGIGYINGNIIFWL